MHYPSLPPDLDLSDNIVTGNTGCYRLIKPLGQGTYGLVWLAVDHKESTSSSEPEPKKYAIKIMERFDVGSSRWCHQQREFDAHQSVGDHPNIAEVYDVFECKYFVYMVMEYCEGGDLIRHVIECHTYSRKSELLKSVFLQILDALEYCHDAGVYHRDLKPDNVLTNHDGTQVKLSDFGLCTNAKVSDTFGCGSSNFISPEALGEDTDKHPYATDANDVWALGVILCNLATGRCPWKLAVKSDSCYATYLTTPGYFRNVLPVSRECASVLEDILNPDPVARITIPQLRERILAIDDFFMSTEDIMKGNAHVLDAAATHKLFITKTAAAEKLAHTQSILSDEEARKLFYASTFDFGEEVGTFEIQFPMPPSGFALDPQRSYKRIAASNPGLAGKFVIAPSDGISDYDSSSDEEEESKGPFTPQTHAQDAAKLVEVPDFCERETIGDAALILAEKGCAPALPVQEGPECVAIPVVA